MSGRARSSILLAALTLACLLPFCGKAFNVDDPLFLWSAQQIVKHPLDPYGFDVIWDATAAPFSSVTKNPPLACYYAALVGSIAGLSERALHIGFLLPAVALVLGTYRLAERLTSSPLVAASATLLTPGVLVSATSVMCDVSMVALWVWAIVLWLDGLERDDRQRLLASAILMCAAALTKYFGICLAPLLLAYSLQRRRRFGAWAWYFVLPVAMLAAYQFWMSASYGRALLFDAAAFATAGRWNTEPASVAVNALIAASFAGGCALSALALAPLVWRWRFIPAALFSGGLLSYAIVSGGASLGTRALAQNVQGAIQAHGTTVGLQLALLIAGGIAILALAAADLRVHKDADSMLLALWVFGTFLFAGFLNWTVNSRSILPLIPAVGILLARRLDRSGAADHRLRIKIAAALALSGGVSLWVTAADAGWAGSQREAARQVRESIARETGAVRVEGHWGFQYYTQQAGLKTLDLEKDTLEAGDLLIMPEGNIQTRTPPERFIRQVQALQIELRHPVTTMRWRMGSGFYGSVFGPLPFAFGTVQPERYFLIRIGATLSPQDWH